MPTKPRIVGICDHAPYLGGPQTWQPLREKLPEYDFVGIDPLQYVDPGTSWEDYAARLRNALIDALPGTSAVIAHGYTAALALEAVAQVNPAIPLILLESRLIREDDLRVRIVRWLLTGPIGSIIIPVVARNKYEKLLGDRAFVREQLKLLVREDAISDALLDEACDRLASPKAKVAVDRTIDGLRVMLRTVNKTALERVKPRVVLVGPHWRKKKELDNPAIRIVERCKMAPMLDAPDVVADTLRSLVPATEELENVSAV